MGWLLYLDLASDNDAQTLYPKKYSSQAARKVYPDPDVTGSVPHRLQFKFTLGAWLSAARPLTRYLNTLSYPSPYLNTSVRCQRDSLD